MVVYSRYRGWQIFHLRMSLFALQKQLGCTRVKWCRHAVYLAISPIQRWSSDPRCRKSYDLFHKCKQQDICRTIGHIVGQNLRKLFLQDKCFFAASIFFNSCHVPYTSIGQNSSMQGLLKIHFRFVQHMTHILSPTCEIYRPVWQQTKNYKIYILIHYIKWRTVKLRWMHWFHMLQH